MKFSKNLYLDDDLRIDSELKSASQNELRDRLRTGHIVHNIIGDLAVSLHDFVRVPDKERLAALMDLLKHHERLQNRINPKPAKRKAIEKQEEQGKPETPKRKHNFGMPGA